MDQVPKKGLLSPKFFPHSSRTLYKSLFKVPPYYKINCCPNSDVSKGILIIRTVNLSLTLHLGLLFVLSSFINPFLSYTQSPSRLGTKVSSLQLQSPWKTPPSMLSSPECKATHPLSLHARCTLLTPADWRLKTGDFICMQSGYKLKHGIFCLCDPW